MRSNWEVLHRKRKREMEMKIVINLLKRHKDKFSDTLEFGCGDGFQIPYLKDISLNIQAIDIEINTDTKKKFPKICSIQSINNTSFDQKKFDLIFSNHVIEHLTDLSGAFNEMKRIGRDDCFYVFSLPTNIWLLLSLPAQYFIKVRSIIKSLLRKKDNLNSNRSNISASFLSQIMPKGHGEYYKFIDCYKNFRIRNWQRLFESFDFNIIQIEPLLLYSASEFPVIPTTKAFKKINLCSSVLFILKKSKPNR